MSLLQTLVVIQELIDRYRDSNYKFHLTDSTKCLYCSQILNSAYQTNCGCRYCKKCLDEYQAKGNTKCLGVDCEDIESTMIDNAVNREIANLKVSCLFASEGCKFTNSLKNMTSHLEECEFKPISCSNCKKLVASAELENHLQKECSIRIVMCDFCNIMLPFETLKSTHLNPEDENLCYKFIGICPNNCGETKRIFLRDHLENCTNKPMKCPYSEFGCNVRASSLKIDNHLTLDSRPHSTQLITYLKTELESLNEKFSNLSKMYKSLLDDKDSLKQEITRLQQDSSRSARSISRPMVNTLKENVTVHRNGTYIWKIENFKSLRQSAENGEKLSVTSEPFYTREFGYKMSMKIYPAGDGLGKGSHLSVFFTLMRGDYDDILNWPFKNKVTLTILDQINKTNDYSDTFKPDSRSTCYQQPTEDYNIASGSPKFITFTQLYETYLKNETIFLKIQVLT